MHEGNVSYAFNQQFCDGSKRSIVISTQMTERDSIDMLVVTESVYYPFGFWGKGRNTIMVVVVRVT
jgi:hypothetical protein